MKIELFKAIPPEPRPNPLLFVHGAFCSGRVWAECFLPFFASRGFATYALSLRGHGNSEGGESLGLWRLADYVDDVAQVVAELPDPPILIGHSMGGMVIQKYLEHRRDVAAIGLMASVPPRGLLSTLAGMWVANPLLFQQLGIVQTMGPNYSLHGLIGQALFADPVPADRTKLFFDGFQGESPLATWDLIYGDPLGLDPDELDIPVFVLGAEHDPFVSDYGIERTARFYGVEPRILPVGHAMMLDRRWRQVAVAVLEAIGENTNRIDDELAPNVVRLF